MEGDPFGRKYSVLLLRGYGDISERVKFQSPQLKIELGLLGALPSKTDTGLQRGEGETYLGRQSDFSLNL